MGVNFEPLPLNFESSMADTAEEKTLLTSEGNGSDRQVALIIQM